MGGKGKGKGKSKGKGKGKGNGKCPSVAEIMDWAAEEYAGEICVFSEMGWLDNDFNTNDELIETDIDTLPSEIAESLKGDEYDECVVEAEKKMEKMAKKKMKKCTYSEEDIAQLDDLGTGTRSHRVLQVYLQEVLPVIPQE